MNTQIKCPFCNKSFEPTDAFKHELEEKIINETQQKHQEEINQLKLENQKIKDSNKKEFDNAVKQVVAKANLEAQQNMMKELKDRDNQILELRKRAEVAEEQELKIRKEKRELEEDKRKFEIEKQRQLDEERVKIRASAIKEVEDKTSLVIAQEKKKNEDLQKQVSELDRKLQLGSQQAQGEILELELEETLKRQFSSDEIIPIAKGVNGPDITHKIVDKYGQICGTIIWETKRAKNWKEEWIQKLKDDQRNKKAELAILVTTVLPKGIKSFDIRDGVWVSEFTSAIGLATALRTGLLNIYSIKQASVGKNEKMEILYNYLCGIEFKQKVEAIVESFTAMKTDLEREKSAMTKIWETRDKQITRVVDNTAKMYGDLTGLMGKALPKIELLELPEYIK